MTTSLKIKSFDTARATGMIYIIAVWHLADYTSMFNPRPYGTYVTYGVLGMFMFLSGWLLNEKYVITKVTDIRLFAKKRILRLMPLYLIALVTFYFSGGFNLKTLLLALFGLSSFFPPQPPTLWFVSLIIDFYLLFPLLSYRKYHFSDWIFYIIYVVIILIDSFTPNIDKRFLLYFPCFYAGILFNRLKLLPYLLKWQTSLISIILFCISLSLDEFVQIKILRLLNCSIVALTFTAIIIYISNALTSLSVYKIFSWIAYSSMAAYMFHRQIIGVLRRLSIWPKDGLERLLFLLLVCVPLILLLGYAIQKAYDFIVKRLKANGRNN